MESAIALPELPLKKNPRPGQRKAIELIAGSEQLNIKLPTGYGKTFTACACYAVKQRQGINRVLFVFPTVSQLEQFKQDGPNDLREAGVLGPKHVIDVRHLGRNSLDWHHEDKASVYAITIQSLSQAVGDLLVNELFATGNWMVIVDEYHHYGQEKVWGRAVSQLEHKALLAMSATPYRPDDDSAFGYPDVDIKYRQAASEKAVKPLKGHSYTYRLSAVNQATGEIQEYTTDELILEAGGDSQDAIEKLEITKNMRWQSSFISPLIEIPIKRLMEDRVRTGIRLQAIVTALTCSHAKMVCEQVRNMFDHLEVDWVGTGPYGRTDEENAAILKRFCPAKGKDGKRRPEIDVLIHVGMAGEGLDSVNVTEVIFLNRASFVNTIIQIIGRAARVLCGPDGNPLTGHINFDSSSDFAKGGYIGGAIMDAIDGDPPEESDEDGPVCGDGTGDKKPREPKDIQDLLFEVIDLELEKIDSGSEEVVLMHETMRLLGGEFAILAERMSMDANHPGWVTVIEVATRKRDEEMKALHVSDRISNMSRRLDDMVRLCTGEVCKRWPNIETKKAQGSAGEVIKRINKRKKWELGSSVQNDIEILSRHLNWIDGLLRTVKEKGVPQWLLS